MKACRTCHEGKELEEFHRDKTSADGHRGECKSCAHIRKTRWVQENRERYRAYQADWTHDNVDMMREGQKRRYWKDPDRFRAKSRKAYWEDPEKMRAQARATYLRAKARKAEQ